MLPNILPKIPPHSTYVEPFAGSLAVFLNKKPSKYEIVNDLDSDIATFWRTLKYDSKPLLYKIMMTPFSRSVFGNVAEALFRSEEKLSDVDRALYTYVILTQGITRMLDSSVNEKNLSLYRDESHSVVLKNNTWRNVQYAQKIISRIQNTKVFNQDAIKVMKRFDGKNTFVYLDPPYVLSTVRDTKGRNYKTNVTEEWHEEFLKTALRCKSKIMISGYESDLYHDYLKDWECFKYTKHSNMARSFYKTQEKIVIKNDCLWVNYSVKGEV